MNKHKTIGGWSLILLSLILISLAVYSIARKQMSLQSSLRIGNDTFRVIMAETEATRAIGLSKKTALAADEGLLMVFEADEKWSIWMKDMSFPIDVIWLDKNKMIVDIEKNVQPASYPRKFKPDVMARYVFEVAAGQVDERAIKVGTVAAFNHKE